MRPENMALLSGSPEKHSISTIQLESESRLRLELIQPVGGRAVNFDETKFIIRLLLQPKEKRSGLRDERNAVGAVARGDGVEVRCPVATG